MWKNPLQPLPPFDHFYPAFFIDDPLSLFFYCILHKLLDAQLAHRPTRYRTRRVNIF